MLEAVSREYLGRYETGKVGRARLLGVGLVRFGIRPQTAVMPEAVSREYLGQYEGVRSRVSGCRVLRW